MMLGVSVGVVVVGWVGIVYVLSSATSTYNSMTAWTSLVGVLIRGSKSAMPIPAGSLNCGVLP